MIRIRGLFFAGLLLSCVAAPAHAVVRDETICGWIDFEGQYNISLTDAYDNYVLSNDTGEVEGVKTIQINQHGPKWMDQNASESRYCGCVGATFNGAELMKVYNFVQKPASACFNDPKLPQLGANNAPARAPAPSSNSSSSSSSSSAPQAADSRSCSFYEHGNFSGDFFTLGANESRPRLDGFWNDRISSVSMEGGCKARLGQDWDFGGGEATDAQAVPTMSDNWNDRISSVECICGR